MHSVPGGGVVAVLVGVGVGVGVGVAVAVAVAVAVGDLSVPPGVSGGLELALLAGPGCGRPPEPGVAEVPGLGFGSGAGLALWLGWVLGSGGDELADPCLLTGAWRTTSARSTGMPEGRCARGPVRAGGRTSALVVAVELDLAEDVHGFVLAWRVPCTPVKIMLNAP
jgi:hypothetical protein